MKVIYTLKKTANIEEIKETLKNYGGRCAKIVEDKIEYQIKSEQEKEAFEALNKKGFI